LTAIEALAGAWRLVKWETHTPGGSVSLPYGGDLTGLLILTADGWMSGQIMLPLDERLEPDAALVGGAQRYIAYCGPYTFDEASMTLTTWVIASVSRSWVGGEQVRSVELRDGLLILRPPRRPSGEQAVLTWERA
jgi:hypothetical protein